MNSLLKERLAQLGPVRAADQNSCGSPAVALLKQPGVEALERIKSVAAVLALVKRGMPMDDAKAAIESVIEAGDVIVELPLVESVQGLTADMAAAGIELAVQAQRVTGTRMLG
jgi:hypothetical protein